MYLTEGGYTERFGSEELAQVLASNPGATFVRAEADARSIVDGYLAAVIGRGFAVPLALDPIPPRIEEITADLARYELHSKKVTHEIKRRRDQAIAFLEGFVAGKMAIVELLPAATTSAEAGAAFIANERTFTADTLAGY